MVANSTTPKGKVRVQGLWGRGYRLDLKKSIALLKFSRAKPSDGDATGSAAAGTTAGVSGAVGGLAGSSASDDGL